MCTNTQILIALILLGEMASAFGALSRPEFSRYEPILERMPFGSPEAAPVVAEAPVNQAPPPDAFIKTLRMCAITEAEDGLRVGLIDLGSKPPKSFFLYVGDIEDGIELVDAEYASERAKLRKGAEEYWIGMNDPNGAPPPAATAGAPAPTAGPGITTAGAPSASRRSSYADRLRQRREAEQARLKEQMAKPPLTEKEVEVALQQHQMEAIRSGQPALPIQLTPEMDDQLVKEGVLPPIQ